METNNLVIQLILAAMAAMGGGLLALFLKGKQEVKEAVDEYIPEDWHWALHNAAEIAVKAAEQYFEQGDNGAKLDWAIKYVFNYMGKIGLEVSEADRVLIQGAIEKAVFDLKRELESLPDALE